MSSFGVPVVFLVFNRPELTARVLARIREARPTKLFVVADGPRADRLGEAEKCRHVRELIERGVDWPCEVIRDYSEVNLGCGQRVSSGITNAFRQVEEAIILEDDCLPDPSFFPFCAELLERYRNDERIGHIAGINFQKTKQQAEASYYFSRYPHCWGWATWRRAWSHYDYGMKEWPNAVSIPALTAVEARYWKRTLTATKEGKIDTWDYQWTLTCWRCGYRAVVPVVNLVSNIGFGLAATHTTGTDGPLGGRPVMPMVFPLIHLEGVGYDDACDEATARLFFRPAGWRGRLRDAWDVLKDHFCLRIQR